MSSQKERTGFLSLLSLFDARLLHVCEIMNGEEPFMMA